MPCARAAVGPQRTEQESERSVWVLLQYSIQLINSLYVTSDVIAQSPQCAMAPSRAIASCMRNPTYTYRPLMCPGWCMWKVSR